MAAKRKSSFISADAGSIILEYGMLVPILMLLILGTMDIGRLIWTYTTLHRAVEASARCAAVNPAACGTPLQIAARAADEAWGLGVTPASFVALTQSCGAQVTAVYPFPFLVPGLGGAGPDILPNTITLTVTACYPL